MKKLLLIAAMLLPMLAQAFPFQTTSNPDVLPIHWYNLKCNGKYFYYQFTPDNGDFHPSSTATTDDAYLWCFVTTNSGKTLIYNKKAQKYMFMGAFFTSNTSESSINYVEEGSGQNFYICFNQNNSKFYLDYDPENEGSLGQLTRQHPFTVTEALVELETNPTGQLVIGELETYDEYCQLEIYYTGTESCTIDVTIDGWDASTQCSFSRDEEDYTVHIEATATFENPNISPLHTEADVVIPGLHNIVSDELTFTPYNTHIPHNDADPEFEGYQKLFDKDRSTKWCVVNSSGAWEPIWVDFKSNMPFVPTSYTMTTGNDTRSFKGRNPKAWKILGKAKENDEWTTLVNVTDGEAIGLGVDNTTDYPFAISGITKKYQFFRFQVDEIRGKDGYNPNNWVFQLAELQLDGNIDSPDIPTVLGDLNGDGIVDVTDVSLAIDMVLGKLDTDINKADLSGDGIIDVTDVSILIDIVLGKYDPDPSPTDQTFTVNGVSFKMIGVKGGTFTMGASDDDEFATKDEKPAHQVTVNSFSIGETEVTQELWYAVTGKKPSYHTSKYGYTDNFQRPVELVSWEACQNFITKLNELTGKTFRMPTEAEWEYAARGGAKNEGYLYAGSNDYNSVAWYLDDLPSSETGTDGCAPQSVATKAPNELGLYDMSGNVGEYCQDWYGEYSEEEQTNPTGPETGSQYVVRGGGWNKTYRQCRNSARESFSPGGGSNSIGLRLAM